LRKELITLFRQARKRTSIFIATWPNSFFTRN